LFNSVSFHFILTMRKLALMSACLAGAGHGRPVRSPAQQLQIDALEDLFAGENVAGTQKSAHTAVHTLAMFLLAFKSAAFNPSGPMRRDLSGRIHVGQRLPVILMAESMPEDIPKTATGADAYKIKNTRETSSGAKELLEDAKEVEYEEFEKTKAATGEAARSAEAIAAQVALAEAAAAALQGNSELAAALEEKKEPSGKLAMVLKKKKGTITIIGEAVQADDLITMGGYDLDDPVYLSKEFRDGGASAVFARSVYEDSVSADTLKLTAKEQKRASDYPPSLPVVANMPVVDPLQLAQASVDGAAGAVIPLSVAGKDKAAELMAAAEGLGLESLIRVTSAEELSTALELGAKIVVIGDMSLTEAAPLLDSIPDEVVTVADIPYYEVKGAWRMRDAGFNAMVTGRIMLEMSSRDRRPPAALVKAMKSKGSVKYGAGISLGRNEGAKENLGTIAI